ncbi:MAG TPA: phosphate/phosphite/phosphonate ABC transporter substrate-binding protein, partial [Deferrisomatales bacterium]|nr:phosphate/phosphite/phosphonate ABC transporter substrate-binding protein [Deferrisomatales bacterium]
PLVFAAHRGTGVSSLTVPQLRDLYRGAVRNWSALGGQDVPVVLLDRPDYTSPKALLLAGPFAALEIHPEALSLEGPESMDEALGAYAGALGYTSLRDALALGDAVDVLRIDGVYPDPQAVATGRYPFSRPLFFAARDPVSMVVKEWFNHLDSYTGRGVVEAKALVPLRRELRIAVPPMRNIVALEVKYGGLARYLQERLGRPVELTHTATYTDLTEAFRANEVDAAFVGSFAYLVAHLEADVEVLARPDYHGTSHYRGVFYVRADAPYRTVADLRGARLAHAGKTTTAGEVYPAYALSTRGLPPPQKFFREVVDAGSHETAVRLLLEGRADVAAAKDLVVADMAREEPGLAARLRELDSSPPVPSNGFAAGPLLGAELRQQIQGLLLSMDQSPRGRKALEDMGAVRFLPTTDADYADLYAMVEAIAGQLVDYFQYR